MKKILAYVFISLMLLMLFGMVFIALIAAFIDKPIGMSIITLILLIMAGGYWGISYLDSKNGGVWY